MSTCIVRHVALVVDDDIGSLTQRAVDLFSQDTLARSLLIEVLYSLI